VSYVLDSLKSPSNNTSGSSFIDARPKHGWVSRADVQPQFQNKCMQFLSLPRCRQCSKGTWTLDQSNTGRKTCYYRKKCRRII